jgi:hypothetical protein
MLMLPSSGATRTNTSLAPVDYKGTEVVELAEMADNKADFTKDDILARHYVIVEGFIDYHKRNHLIG